MENSEYWPPFNLFPPVLHVVSAKTRADGAALMAIQRAAVARWDAAFAAITEQCTRRGAKPRTCDQLDYLWSLRWSDESYLGFQTPRPASRKAPAS